MLRMVTGLTLLIALILGSEMTAMAQENTAENRVHAAANRLKKKQLYQLQYKFKKGETVRWNVEHTASTKMQMAGKSEESSSRSVTQKCWRVKSVDVHGNITFVHSFESIKAWQKVGDAEPVSYDSTKDKEAPEEYETTASQLKKPLAVITIKSDGAIIDRKSALKESAFGVGKVTIPLPKDPIAIGKQWQVPKLLNATDEFGNQKKLKARILYQLTEVRGTLASIKFKTEVLTPVKSQKVKSTIMQQLTEGLVVFDIKNGRPVAKQVQWDEKAVGFEGPDSLLTLVGKMTEKMVVEDVKQAANAKSSTAKASKLVKIKTTDSAPILRAK